MPILADPMSLREQAGLRAAVWGGGLKSERVYQKEVYRTLNAGVHPGSSRVLISTHGVCVCGVPGWLVVEFPYRVRRCNETSFPLGSKRMWRGCRVSIYVLWRRGLDQCQRVFKTPIRCFGSHTR